MSLGLSARLPTELLPPMETASHPLPLAVAQVDLILEGMWRDNELAAEEMGAVLVAVPPGFGSPPTGGEVTGSSATPTDPLPPPPSHRRRPRVSARATGARAMAAAAPVSFREANTTAA